MIVHSIPTTRAFRFIGNLCLLLGVLTVLSASLAYAPSHPGFSMFNTYLSDIGDTPGWPQVLFNTGTLLAAPLRLAVLLLFVIRLRSYTDTRGAFEFFLLILGLLSTLGTVLMTAVPFSVAPAVHKSGIVLYFLGVVFLQSMMGMKELAIKSLPRFLPVLSFAVVVCFLVFFVLMILYEVGTIGRATPVFWEWMCFGSSMLWLLGHSLVLGREESGGL